MATKKSLTVTGPSLDGEYFIQQRDEIWYCMLRKPDGSTVEDTSFFSERAARYHLERCHLGILAGKAKTNKPFKGTRKKNVRPDTVDFRDVMYSATLFEVPVAIQLEEYLSWDVPILDQGTEGACTGYGLATVANYLLRKRKIFPDKNKVSPSMIYHFAKRYDEWPGQSYEGSSARGAMKAWHKHGVCGEACFKSDTKDFSLTKERTADALIRPLGAYYRVNHKDIIAMHTALAEVGILYATASVHSGWDDVGEDGKIPYKNGNTGGHAFAIVAYDKNGFWIQNSWGDGWGREGFGQISYDDWLKNGSDVWVARLGAPIVLSRDESTSIAHSAGAKKSVAYSYPDLKPHVVSLGNNGKLSASGEFGTDAEDVRYIFRKHFVETTEQWSKKRILLYAHGGLVSEKAAVQRLADYKSTLLKAEIYPLSIIWHSDSWTTITNLLKDVVQRRRSEGIIDATKDFLLDRLDDMLEVIARPLTGKLQWGEMKENALDATLAKDGGLRTVLEELKRLSAQFGDDFEVHLIGHSAGSIVLGPLLDAICTTAGKKAYDGRLNGIGLNIQSCTLWAPACTGELFKQYYKPHIKSEKVKTFTVFNLTEQAELDDNCAQIYHKSLLYLVSNAFEETVRDPFSGKKYGEPILGIVRCIQDDEELKEVFSWKNANLVQSPNTDHAKKAFPSTCQTHGGFDDDPATVETTLNIMLGATNLKANMNFEMSASALKDRRDVLNAAE